MTATARVRKHRAKLREEQCSRLEVWIGTWIVQGIRQLAKTKGRETWAEVQDVLEHHLLVHGSSQTDVNNLLKGSLTSGELNLSHFRYATTGRLG